MSRASIPDLLLEKLLNGELEPQRARDIEEALEAAGDDRLDVMRAENEEILARYPAQRVAKVVRARAADAPAKRGLSPAVVWGGVVVALAAVVLLAWRGAVTVGVLGGQGADPQQGEIAQAEDSAGDPGLEGGVEALDPLTKEDTRLKGMAPLLHVHRKTEGKAEKLQENAIARQGDVLQVSYVAAGRKYGAVVSFDGKGVVTWHFPERVGASTELSERTGVVPLGHSYELDDAPEFERFVFIAGPQPIDTAALDREIRAMAKREDAQTRPVIELLAEQQNLSYSNFVVLKDAE